MSQMPQTAGFVSGGHPSDVLPLSWPERAETAVVGPGYAQIGVSVEPLAELGQKEGSKLGAKEDFAKMVRRGWAAWVVSHGSDPLSFHYRLPACLPACRPARPPACLPPACRLPACLPMPAARLPACLPAGGTRPV